MTNRKTSKEPTQIRIVLLNRPFHGFSGSYLFPAYKKMSQWSPRMIISPCLKPPLILRFEKINVHDLIEKGKKKFTRDPTSPSRQGRAKLQSICVGNHDPFSHCVQEEG